MSISVVQLPSMQTWTKSKLDDVNFDTKKKSLKKLKEKKKKQRAKMKANKKEREKVVSFRKIHNHQMWYKINSVLLEMTVQYIEWFLYTAHHQATRMCLKYNEGNYNNHVDEFTFQFLIIYFHIW